ncbi:MAG: tetraacyldisaccharide 4'-kinase [Candidatus Tectomicrobia bacterium]|uniref:Tetraacyldisaccharide 4'-kinase n=1 Tax=Tectimicrobiota bacterium TaxID=2528274 RepID=A0A932CQW3_UNCTE|nr:tetraacyldisaccharide 4'-kinase [Candidatus Tectomicrobia bacterium]
MRRLIEVGEGDDLLPSILASPLAALSLAYGAIQQFRSTLYRRGTLKARQLPCRVISVGNLVSGGTGKTPLVERLASLLRDQGIRVAILSRGYKGKARQPVSVVSDGERLRLGPLEAGDEPYLLARNLPGVPVLVGVDRYRVGLYACEQFAAQVVLLDDGYQRLSLARDLNLLLLDATRPFGNGWVLPRGLLREPVSALSRAQAVLLTRCQHPPHPSFSVQVARRRLRVPVFQSCHVGDSLFELREGQRAPLDLLQGKRVVAFCGLANPGSFRDLIERLGGRIVHFLPFIDHHRYHGRELREIGELCRSLGTDLALTTEKDGVKLTANGDGTALPFPLWVLRIRMELTGEGEGFERLILRAAGAL